MSDDTTTKPLHGNLIETRQEQELRHWCEKWGVSHDAIKWAINKVGPMVKDVAHELGKA